MKAVAKALELGGANFRFCDKDALKTLLGVEQGALSPLALAHDTAAKVTFVLDEGVAKQEAVLVHPCVNTATVSLPTAALVAFAGACGHAPRMLDFDQLSAAGPPSDAAAAKAEKKPAAPPAAKKEKADAAGGGGGTSGTQLGLQHSKAGDFTAWYAGTRGASQSRARARGLRCGARAAAAVARPVWFVPAARAPRLVALVVGCSGHLWRSGRFPGAHAALGR
jgi:hypothetical protein